MADEFIIVHNTHAKSDVWVYFDCHSYMTFKFIFKYMTFFISGVTLLMWYTVHTVVFIKNGTNHSII